MLRDKALLFGQRFIERFGWLLFPFSLVYALVVLVRNRLYDLSILPVYKASPIVVSIGNITVGGNGKTPFAILLAKGFPGRKVAILSRAVGKTLDEPLLFKRRGIEVFVGKNRAALAKKLSDYDLLILDDGFQHRKLFRDFDIVLTRGQKGFYLPAGFFRDSPKRLRKADRTFKVGKDIGLYPEGIRDLRGNKIPSIRGWEMVLFSGIANPKSFREMAEAQGVRIVGEKIFADHGTIDFNALPPAKAYLCTEKDAVKIGKTSLPIYVLEVEMRYLGPEEDWQNLIAKIEEKIDNRPL